MSLTLNLKGIYNENLPRRAKAIQAADKAKLFLAEATQDACAQLARDAEKRDQEMLQEQRLLAVAMEHLEEQAAKRTGEARGWLNSFDNLCNDMQGLGDTEDWLDDIESQMRSMTKELEYVSQQLAFVHLKSDPI